MIPNIETIFLRQMASGDIAYSYEFINLKVQILVKSLQINTQDMSSQTQRLLGLTALY